jgi:hypothetical protein
MRRLMLRVAAPSLVIAACGGAPTSTDGTATTITETATSAPSSPDTTTAGTPSTADTDPASPPTVVPSTTNGGATPFDGPEAPDFTLALGSGETFTLSAEQKPVYMVFWAEW